MNTATEEFPSGTRPDRPSIVEEFLIEGLYGYRNVGLTSAYAATILIARNGSGKTTLLACLDAVLRCEFIRLRDIKFSRLTLRLKGLRESIVIVGDEIASLFTFSEGDDIYKISARYGIEIDELLELANADSFTPSNQKLQESSAFQQLTSKLGYDYVAAAKIIENIADNITRREPHLHEVRNKIRSALKGIDIVYLPTYRRIELPLVEDKSSHRRSSVQSKLGLSRRQLYSADIQFGLADISERLRIINQQILIESGERYREITANIINELIDGTYERGEHGPESLPDKNSLVRFFSKIEESKRFVGRRFRFENFETLIPDVERVYDASGRTAEVEKVLNYFLGKLAVVIDKTKGLENQVHDFISVCNSYLSGNYVGSENDNEKESMAWDDKILVKNDKNMQVTVHIKPFGKKVDLDALSSGEKQMISLFARIYLYPGKKMVLIDEPELSLSLGWQRKILMDVVTAPTCAQVVAITHSPFVFDNELEPFAKALKVGVDVTAVGASGSEAGYPTDLEEGS